MVKYWENGRERERGERSGLKRTGAGGATFRSRCSFCCSVFFPTAKSCLLDFYNKGWSSDLYGGVKVCLNYSSQQCMELVRSFRKTFSPSFFSFCPNLRRCRSTHSTNLHHGLQMQTRKCLTDDDRPFSYIMRLLFLFCSGLWSAA